MNNITTKIGRPTENKKTDMLRVRVDKITLEQLDECVKIKNTNRSDVVRTGIKEQYDKLKK